jgi:hypothetical protein
VTGGSIRLSVYVNNEEKTCELTTTSEQGAVKLLPGTYVIAVGCPKWGLYLYEEGSTPTFPGRVLRRTLGGLVPANIEYVTIHTTSA